MNARTDLLRLDTPAAGPDQPDGPAGPQTPALPAPARPAADPGIAVLEKTELDLRPPQMWRVIMINDDFTPMEFVVLVLQEFFNLDLEAATRVMLTIHQQGQAVCGVYTKDVASTKVEWVMAAAQRNGHPLQCTMEAL
ncbi:ATP-dependent Clp protease adapter ClpS [Amphibiibacter pelophylacis]|uniref:ATP-dependent Clp protease adapter ClpS n=1 Tax=Amphibiibacter pelophylacis TaxID=1799477 RepID=A0ACC6NYG2_9BURK